VDDKTGNICGCFLFLIFKGFSNCFVKIEIREHLFVIERKVAS